MKKGPRLLATLSSSPVVPATAESNAGSTIYVILSAHTARVRAEVPMRIHGTLLLSVLALAGCAKASAATVDPNNDYDCAIAFRFYREAARLQGAADKARQGLFTFNQWYEDKWRAEHPGVAEPEAHASAMIDAMAKDPLSYKDVLKTCARRATADSHFDRFAQLLQEDMPGAR